jgi:sterol 14-demethylase
MDSKYKDGTPVPDKEIAHMMIALLMAGQHSSSSTSSWIMLRLAARPDIMEELYQEQIRVLGPDLRPLTYEDLSKLTMHQNVLKEVLRLHTPIHSIMRAVKSPMPVTGTKYVVPTSHVLLASPGCTSRDEEFFPNAELWDPHRWDAGSGGVVGADVEEEKEDYGYGLISKGASSPYLPFGAGRHRCIGEQFATVQLVTITATMVREFKFRTVDGSKNVPATDYSSLFSRPLAPAVIAWERRERA